MTGGYTDTRCTATEKIELSFGAGYKTMLHLHLGLTSIKMDATTTDWDSSEHIIDLPANAKVTAFSFNDPNGDGTKGIDAFGKITGTFKATTTDNGEIELKASEVTFAWGATTLPVTYDGTYYYIPARIHAYYLPLILRCKG